MTCICTSMQPPQLLLLLLSAWEPQCPSIHPPLLPKSSQRQCASPAVVWPEQEHRAQGSSTGAEVTLASAARDWSCSRTQAMLNAQQECAPCPCSLHLEQIVLYISDTQTHGTWTKLGSEGYFPTGRHTVQCGFKLKEKWEDQHYSYQRINI